MKLKILIGIIVMFLIVPFVFAEDSEDCSQYYNDSSMGLCDGITNSTPDFGLSGAEVSGGDAVTSHGWNQSDAAAVYSGDISYKGALSIKAFRGADNIGARRFFSITNNSFRGHWQSRVFWNSSQDTNAAALLQANDGAGTYSFGLDGSVSDTDFTCNGAACDTPTAIPFDTWVLVDMNFTDLGVDTTVNGVKIDQDASPPNGLNFIMYLAATTATSVLYADDIAVFNGDSRPQNVSAPSPFTLEVSDRYDGTTINNFTAIIFNSTDVLINSTTTGSIIYPDLSGIFNISINSTQGGGYFNLTFGDIDTSSDFQARIYQAILYINVSEVITGDQIVNFHASALLQSNTSNNTGFATLFLKADDYNISVNATGYLDTSDNVSFLPLEAKTITIELGTANLTVTANSVISGDSITQFNTSMILLSTGFTDTQETLTGTVIFKTIAGTYNVTINASGFTTANELITITPTDTLPNITFNLFTENSINITIIDEELNQIINFTTTTILFDHNATQFTNSTTTGTMFVDTLLDGFWDILVSTPLHDPRHYFFTVTPQTHTDLTVYLLNSSNGETKTFNVKNSQDQVISGALITVSNKVNNTFVTVAQKFSDFAGQATIFLRSDREYRFTIEATGFSTKVFNLEPIQSSYNIILDSIDIIDFTTIFDEVSYSILPVSDIITISETRNFSIITSSPTGLITYFGLNSSFNSTVRITNVTGSPAGGTASLIIDLTNQSGSTVSIDYFIKLSNQDIIEIHRDYYVGVTAATAGNFSAAFFADKYKDDFNNVMKALLVVVGAVAVILSLAEVGVPAAISGPAGAMVIIAGAIVQWIPKTIAFIVGLITIGMFMLRRGE